MVSFLHLGILGYLGFGKVSGDAYCLPSLHFCGDQTAQGVRSLVLDTPAREAARVLFRLI